MADTTMNLSELVDKAEHTEDVDGLRERLRMLAQVLMEAEVSAQLGAQHGERAPDRRVGQRNCYRPRRWDTRAGTVDLAVPRVRSGPSYFPSFLEARRRAERSLCQVVAQWYVEGVSTRKVCGCGGPDGGGQPVGEPGLPHRW